MTKKQVAKMFLIEGFVVGVLGGGLALVLGYPLGIAAVETLQALSAFELSFSFVPSYGIGIIISSILLSSLAALFPAYRALQERNSESMNYE